MKEYNYKNLRNVGLIGHGATGKTSLAESLLFYTNNTDRLGKVEDGTTVMDYEQEEMCIRDRYRIGGRLGN